MRRVVSSRAEGYPWLFVGGHAFEFVAQKKGWKDRGLDVSITRGYGSGAATKAISAGKAQFGEASYGVVVNGVSKGLDVVCIGAKLQRSPIAISCRADSGIKTVKDLEKGHLVQAANSGDTVMWDGFTRAAGIDGSKVKRTYVHPAKLLSTVLNKKADCQGAYYVSNSATLELKTPSVHFLYADYGMQTLDLGLITGELVTNAFKHAFPDRSEGRISIRLTTESDTIRYRFSDDGVGLAEGQKPERSGSLGWRMIRSSVSTNMGHMTVGVTGGLTVDISFPRIS